MKYTLKRSSTRKKTPKKTIQKTKKRVGGANMNDLPEEMILKLVLNTDRINDINALCQSNRSIDQMCETNERIIEHTRLIRNSTFATNAELKEAVKAWIGGERNRFLHINRWL